MCTASLICQNSSEPVLHGEFLIFILLTVQTLTAKNYLIFLLWHYYCLYLPYKEEYIFCSQSFTNPLHYSTPSLYKLPHFLHKKGLIVFFIGLWRQRNLKIMPKRSYKDLKIFWNHHVMYPFSVFFLNFRQSWTKHCRLFAFPPPPYTMLSHDKHAVAAHWKTCKITQHCGGGRGGRVGGE